MDWGQLVLVASTSLVLASFIKYGFEYLINRLFFKAFDDVVDNILTNHKEEFIQALSQGLVKKFKVEGRVEKKYGEN